MYLHIVPTFFDNISTIGLKSSSIIEQQETEKSSIMGKKFKGKMKNIPDNNFSSYLVCNNS